MIPLSITDLENFAFDRYKGVQNLKNSNTNMENYLTPSDQNLIKANLAFTNFFLDDDLENTQFTFTVSNASTAAQNVYIYTGVDANFSDLQAEYNGVTINKVVKDGPLAATPGVANAAGIHLVTTTSGTPNVTVDNVLSYLRTKNIQVTKIRAKFSDLQQASQSLVIKQFNPLRTLRDEYKIFTNDSLKGVPDQTIFDINEDIWLTKDMGIQISMLAGSANTPNKITFTFFFGLQMKDSVMFERMIKLYTANAKQVAPTGVVQGVSQDLQAFQTSPIAGLLG